MMIEMIYNRMRRDFHVFSLADRIERTCGRFLALFGISSPKLTSAQWRLRSVHTTQLMVR